ncbi:hypothetical protein TNIN_454001 [Trichonephila inaurata madagascariensis]|uniref:Uncharacterized protein n=1 Tax=Trichonephila inaurata madagascariensis TaxID=2747483 RepID=A0A8X6WVD8_9ARAC|nr:hypothetical protein TNIN_454001 [Trichonephila inaurata madagascariensis]
MSVTPQTISKMTTLGAFFAADAKVPTIAWLMMLMNPVVALQQGVRLYPYSESFPDVPPLRKFGFVANSLANHHLLAIRNEKLRRRVKCVWSVPVCVIQAHSIRLSAVLKLVLLPESGAFGTEFCTLRFLECLQI